MAKSAVFLTSAALALTGLGAAGWAAWNSTSAAHGDRRAGSTIAIEVVPPREPDLQAAPILPVGELRNGYRHDPERLKGLAADLPVESAWLEWYEPLPDPASIIIVAPLEPPPVRQPDLDRNDYSFGFDAPQPDYAAEREARQSALSDPPAVSDSVFY